MEINIPVLNSRRGKRPLSDYRLSSYDSRSEMFLAHESRIINFNDFFRPSRMHHPLIYRFSRVGNMLDSFYYHQLRSDWNHAHALSHT